MTRAAGIGIAVLAAAAVVPFALAARNSPEVASPPPAPEAAQKKKEALVRPGPSCDRVASPRGSDRWRGTREKPVRSIRRLVRLLRRGQTGCLRQGVFRPRRQIIVNTRGVTLRNFPGERVTVRGPVALVAPSTELRGVRLRQSCARPHDECITVVLKGPRSALRNSDVTNGHGGICVVVDNGPHGEPDGFVVTRNRIHGCGILPAENHHHGVYVNRGTGGRISSNVIFDTSDRGVQLFPNARRTVVALNTIDGNGQGVIIGGSSSANVIAGNVISNSTLRFNLEWFDLDGTGNVARGNCLFASNPLPAYRADGGIQDYARGAVGLLRNVVGDPRFVSREAGDFRLRRGSPCAGKGAPATVARP